ncbi:MAG TPA: hypothetical protein VMY37_37515 [Thermoguttaceae bacterium]|nr:hypothetical protein [Thermoguttaceae bacterium]
MKTYFCDLCGRYLGRRECKYDIDEITPFPAGPLCPACDCFVRARGLMYVLVGLSVAPLLWLLLWAVLPSIATLPSITVACGMSAVGLVKMVTEQRRRRQLAGRVVEGSGRREETDNRGQPDLKEQAKR